jgi:hypothetical protein
MSSEINKANFHMDTLSGSHGDFSNSLLGTKMAEVLPRCIHHSHMPRGKAEAWVKSPQAMLHKGTWSMVQELKAQPRAQQGA